jgi:secreted trypsin-like serine protease
VGRSLILVLVAMFFWGCGKPPSQRRAVIEGDSIINGTPIEARESAAAKSVVMVELLNGDNQRLGFCTGTLITESNIVLTAAHCFDLRIFPSLRKFNVLFVNSLRQRSAAVARKGVAFSLNAAYNRDGGLDHDIAVLLFQNAAPPGFAPVAIDQDANANYGSKTLFVYGYGRTEDYTGLPNQEERPNPGILHRGLMMVDPDYNRFSDRYFTKIDSETSLCQGDSGGPQFFNEKSVLKVVGVNSGVLGKELPNGKHSCKGQGQATKVARFAPWIKKEIKALKKKYWFGINPEEELVNDFGKAEGQTSF